MLEDAKNDTSLPEDMCLWQHILCKVACSDRLRVRFLWWVAWACQFHLAVLVRMNVAKKEKETVMDSTSDSASPYPLH